MTLPPPSEHFQGKSAADHLRDARARGAAAAAEIHGTEVPGHLSAGSDSAKETTLLLLFLWVILTAFSLSNVQILTIFAVLSCGLLIWKTGRSALLGWARLERLHRLIEEERWEIEHHRSQEREELTELYRAKGFEGKLLEEVIDVLMADDNRLLRIMLEEELGLSLETYEHPLKQSLGAAIGVIGSSAVLLSAFWMFPRYGMPSAALILLMLSSAFAAKMEKNRALSSVIWNLAIAALACGIIYFATQQLLH
jgi:vacuolar iron transporter family protein